MDSNLILITSAVHMTTKMLFEKTGFEIVAFPIKFCWSQNYTNEWYTVCPSTTQKHENLPGISGAYVLSSNTPTSVTLCTAI